MSSTVHAAAPAGRHREWADSDLAAQVRAYWETQIHDREISPHAEGSPEFFRDLDAYRLEKLDYLLRRIDFVAEAGRDVLEIGCGLALDLVRFARGGARTVGIDLSEHAVRLAQRGFDHSALGGTVLVGDGARLPFHDESFDFVYCHGVLPYVADPQSLVRETHRVLRPGGRAVLMAYNRQSWLALLSRLTRTRLAHQDAPVFRASTPAELRRMLHLFADSTIVTDRFPVATKLHSGWKAAVYNRTFISLFRLVPTRWLAPWGWHILAFCTKSR